MKDKKKLFWFFIITIIPLLFTILLTVSGIRERMESVTIDFRHQYFNPNHKFSDKVILIDFDEDTFKKLGNKREFIFRKVRGISGSNSGRSFSTIE